MARPSAEEMFRNMIGRRDTSAAKPVEEAAAPAAEKKKASTVQVTVRLRPEQHRQLKEAALLVKELAGGRETPAKLHKVITL